MSLTTKVMGKSGHFVMESIFSRVWMFRVWRSPRIPWESRSSSSRQCHCSILHYDLPQNAKVLLLLSLKSWLRRYGLVRRKSWRNPLREKVVGRFADTIQRSGITPRYQQPIEASPKIQNRTLSLSTQGVPARGSLELVGHGEGKGGGEIGAIPQNPLLLGLFAGVEP